MNHSIVITKEIAFKVHEIPITMNKRKYMLNLKPRKMMFWEFMRKVVRDT